MFVNKFLVKSIIKQSLIKNVRITSPFTLPISTIFQNNDSSTYRLPVNTIASRSFVTSNIRLNFHNGEIDGFKDKIATFQLFIGNVPPSIDNDKLRELLLSRSPSLLDVQLFIDRNSLKSKGFGYASYPSRESADKALIALEGIQCLNNILRIETSEIGKRSLHNVMIKQRQWSDNSKKTVYVGNISPDVKETDLYALVDEILGSEQGVLKGDPHFDVKISYDAITGKCKGYAHVYVADKDLKDKLIADINGKQLDGYIIRASQSKSKDEQQITRGGYGNDFSVFLGNLPWETDREHIKSMLKDVLGENVYKEVRMGRDITRTFHQPKGFCHVDLYDYASCERAAKELNGLEIMGRTITCFIAARTGDVNRPEERSLFPSTRSVILKNLPCKDMNSNEMKNNLSDMINDVLGLHLFTAVRVGVDKESGLPNGYGFVDFKDPATCEIAINEFNSMVVMDKKIVCDYAVNAENVSSLRRNESLLPFTSKPPTVFIGNLETQGLDTIRIKEMIDYVLGVDLYKSVRLALDKVTGEPLGYCFIDFKDYATCERAVRELNGLDDHGRTLKCNFHHKKSTGKNVPSGSGGKNNYTLPSLSRSFCSSRTVDPTSTPTSTPPLAICLNIPHTVFLGNLSNEIADSKVVEEMINDVLGANMFTAARLSKANHYNLKIAHIDFKDQATCERAVKELNGRFFFGREIRCDLHVDTQHGHYSIQDRYVSVLPTLPASNVKDYYKFVKSIDEGSNRAKNENGPLWAPPAISISNVPEISSDMIKVMINKVLGENLYNSVTLAVDNKSIKSMEYAQVHFKDFATCKRAIEELDGLWVLGKQIKCNFTDTLTSTTSTNPSPFSTPFSRYHPPKPSIYIGNLSRQRVDMHILKDLINDVLDSNLIVSIRLPRNKETGEALGFAHVDFRDQATCERAIKELDGLEVLGNRIRCDYGETRNIFSSDFSHTTKAHKYTIYIGNLQKSETASYLLKDVINDVLGEDMSLSVRLGVDNTTQKPAGFAHVDFKDYATCERAMKGLDGLEMMGHIIRCNITDKTIQQEMKERGITSGSGSSGIDLFNSHLPKGLLRYTMFIGNLVINQIKTDLLRDLIQNILGADEFFSVRLAKHRNNQKPMGYAFIDFKDPFLHERAIRELNGLDFMGKKLQCKDAEKGPKEKEKQEEEKMNLVAVHKKNTVYIGNLLGSEIDNAMLKDMLDHTLGPDLYHSVRVIMDNKTGKPTGYAFVVFKDYHVSQRAIRELDGLEMFGRAIQCREAEVNKYSRTIEDRRNRGSVSSGSTSGSSDGGSTDGESVC